MAHRRQREEDARQQHQHPGRQIHHLRPDGSPPLLSGHDQGEGDSGQEGGHRPRLPGHGGRTDLFPRYSGGLLPDQFGPQVGIPDADLRRGRPARLLLPRFRLLLHPQPTHGPRPHGGHLHARIVGGSRRIALHQTLQVHGQPQRPVLEHPHRREGRTRLPQTEHLPPAMDALAGSEGQPGLHLLRIGQLRHERLLQIRGHDDQ